MATPFGDPQTMAILGLAQGLLAAGSPSPMPVSMGGALAQGFGGALNNAMATQKMNQQQALVDVEKQKAALLGQQVRQADDKNKAMEDVASKIKAWEQAGLKVAPTGMIGVSDQSAAATGAPWLAASGLQQPAPAARPAFPFTLGDIARLKGAGVDIMDVYKEAQPNISIQNGFQVDPRLGIVGSVPTTNQQGFSTITVRDPSSPSGYRVQMVPGGNEAFTQQQLISHGSQAAFGSPITIPASSPSASPTMVNPYRLAVSQGAPDVLGAKGAEGAPKPASGAAGVPAGLSADQQAAQAATTEQQKKIGENYGTIYNNLQNAAMGNPAKIAKTQRVGQLLADYEGGKLSKSAMNVAQIGNSLGIKIDPKLPAKEAAEALSGEIALSLRDTSSGAGMPGAMSDADREFLKGMTPNLSLTADGRKQIIDSKVKVMEREVQVAKMARQYKQKYGGINEDFFNQLQQWSDRNPIFAK